MNLGCRLMVRSIKLSDKLKRSNQVGREELGVVDEIVDSGLRIGVGCWIEADIWHSAWNFGLFSHADEFYLWFKWKDQVFEGVSWCAWGRLPVSKLKLCCTRRKSIHLRI